MGDQTYWQLKESVGMVRPGSDAICKWTHEGLMKASASTSGRSCQR